MKDADPTLFTKLSLRHREGHPQTVAVFQTVAEGFHVPVTDDDRRYWRSMLTVARALDSLVDTNHPASLTHVHNRLIAGLPIAGIEPAEAETFRDILETVSPEKHDVIIEGLAINDYAAAIRSTRSFATFLRLRTEEAELFGRIMQLDNPTQVTATDRFNQWLPRFARAGYLIDSFGDLSKDLKNGIITFHPSFSRRLRLGTTALVETKAVVSELPPRTVARLAVAGVSQIVRNNLTKKSSG